MKLSSIVDMLIDYSLANLPRPEQYFTVAVNALYVILMVTIDS